MCLAWLGTGAQGVVSCGNRTFSGVFSMIITWWFVAFFPQ